MNALRKLYKELTSLHWEIGFLDNTFEGIVRGDKLKLTLVTHNFPNSWFADPFILHSRTRPPHGAYSSPIPGIRFHHVR